MVDLEKKFIEFCEELPEALDENDNPIMPSKRRVIFIVELEKVAEEWSKHFTEEFFDESASAYIKGFFKGLLVIPSVIVLKEGIERRNFLKKYYQYPIIDVEDAQKNFQFPPNHPQHNMLYAMCDILPNLYVPLSTFHDYIQDMKHSSFIELCASLGAKEIYYESDETDNKSFGINASSDTPVEKVSIDGHKNNNTNKSLAYKFPEKNSNTNEDYQSEWLAVEPTWKSMKKMRINNHVESFIVNYNYTVDFGINADLAAKCKGIG